MRIIHVCVGYLILSILLVTGCDRSEESEAADGKGTGEPTVLIESEGFLKQGLGEGFQASIELRWDHEAMAKYGMSQTQSRKIIEEFFQTHRIFTLDELKQIQVVAAEDRKVPLSVFAEIVVRFERTE